MNDRIVFADGTTFQQPESPEAPVQQVQAGRDWKRLAVIGTPAAVAARFSDDATYHHVWESETGEGAIEVLSEDLSAYCVAGEIVDMRDGCCWVYMGKPTDLEIAYELLYGGDAQ